MILVLYWYLDDESQNPSSLDFKRFKGKSMLQSTHVMDDWADLDARRIFGHFEGGRFVLDRLSKGVPLSFCEPPREPQSPIAKDLVEIIKAVRHSSTVSGTQS